MKKLIFISCIFLTVLNSSAQEFRPFVGLGGFVHLYSFEKDLQSSPAISLSAGLEIQGHRFFIAGNRSELFEW